jgi:hypothetical protein
MATRKRKRAAPAQSGFDRKLLLKYRRGRRASPEDKVIVDIINDFYMKGMIQAEGMPLVREIFAERVRQMRAAPPDDDQGHAFTQTIVSTRSIIRSTVFYRFNKTELLFSAADGALIARGVPHSIGPGTVAEMIAELFLLVLELWTHVGEGAKKAAEEIAGKVASNPTVRSLLEKLIKLLKSFGSALEGKAAREAIRDALKELFTLLKDSFTDFLKKVFETLDGWDILFFVIDIFLMFTPVGWLKKYGKLVLGLGLFATHTYKKLNE